MSALSLDAAMRAVADAVERELDRLLPRAGEVPAVLADAMRHACLGGGKRLRPFLAVATGRLLGADEAATLRAGTAVELIHGYSLVHDDLPAMDDAALRRGRPTVHKLFGDANAILAGDALQALAFEVLGRDDWPATPDQRVELVRGLARAAGPAGMCGGQTLDLEAEHQPLDEPGIVRLQALKTGALIAFSADAGCILGRASPAQRRAVRAYAEALGLAFQIRDDMLGIWGMQEATGKPVADDIRRRKQSLPIIALDERADAGTRDELRRIYADAAPLGAESVSRVIDLLARYEIEDYCQSRVDVYHHEARAALDHLAAQGVQAESLRDFLTLLDGRVA
jgi:farnesyl diphosphate synthase